MRASHENSADGYLWARAHDDDAPKMFACDLWRAPIGTCARGTIFRAHRKSPADDYRLRRPPPPPPFGDVTRGLVVRRSVGSAGDSALA